VRCRLRFDIKAQPAIESYRRVRPKNPQPDGFIFLVGFLDYRPDHSGANTLPLKAGQNLDTVEKEMRFLLLKFEKAGVAAFDLNNLKAGRLEFFDEHPALNFLIPAKNSSHEVAHCRALQLP
jgi:hypothetical protein